MIDIIHRIGIKAPVSDVYQAIASVEGVAGWWTKETTGEAKVGKTIRVCFRDHGVEKGQMDLEVRELSPAKAVQWRVTAGPPEWVGTDVTFNLSQEDGYTVLLFGHRNWREAVEFTAHCSMKWATFLLSLRELVEKGAGSPSPDDLKIDNWN
ncbi:MAG TPA: SRPBCC domain-containing protein [Longimicrobiales bacterium]